MYFFHVATGEDSLPKPVQLSSAQPHETYFSGNVEKHNTCKSQNGIRIPSRNSPAQHPIPWRLKIPRNQFAAFFRRMLKLVWWIGGYMKIVVTVKIRNRKSGRDLLSN